MHAGPQDLPIDELKKLWRVADDNGFHWVSVWDHFYANPLVDRTNPCFEGVSAMSALAALTDNLQRKLPNLVHVPLGDGAETALVPVPPARFR